jgi:hypothetical protein
MENTIRVRQAALALGIAFLVTLHIGTARQASQSAGFATVIGYLPPPPELPM